MAKLTYSPASIDCCRSQHSVCSLTMVVPVHSYFANNHSMRNQLTAVVHCNCSVHIDPLQVAHNDPNGDCNSCKNNRLVAVLLIFSLSLCLCSASLFTFVFAMDYDNCCAVADVWEPVADCTTDISAHMGEMAFPVRSDRVSVPEFPWAVHVLMPALGRLVSFPVG